MKFSIFAAKKILCVLHGQVFSNKSIKENCQIDRDIETKIHIYICFPYWSICVLNLRLQYILGPTSNWFNKLGYSMTEEC